MLRKCLLFVHLLVLSIFPIAFFYVHNPGRVLLTEAVRPAAVALLLTLFAFGIAWLAMRDSVRAGVVVSTVCFGFFVYGNLLLWLMGKQLPIEVDGVIHHPILGLGFFAVLSCLAIRTTRNPQAAQKAAIALLMTAAVLSGFNLAELAHQPREEQELRRSDRLGEVGIRDTDQKPDLYYIILDEYPRSDILRQAYGVDNGSLLDYLRAKGFVIANRSRSNYCHTYPSLASSLNFDFLDRLDPRPENQNPSLLPLGELISHNRAAHYLKGLGYRTVVLSSGMAFSEMYDADVRLNSPWHLSEFEYGWLLSTPIGQMRGFNKLLIAAHRARILSLLEGLPKAAELPGPKFVFAHILCPHSPFVFRNDGGVPEAVTGARFSDEVHLLNSRSSQSEQRFRQQVEFVTRMVRVMVDGILSKSACTPIILLQSDHGNGPLWGTGSLSIEGVRQRSAILNAYLLPSKMQSQVYQNITPVNSFPVILNSCFEANFPLLPDRTYFSQSNRSRQFIDVTGDMRQNPE